jgi:2-phosphosulfolactate phosphatase
VTNSVCIDHLPESAARYGREFAVVAIDVIRATTTLVTAVALGRRCFAVASTAAAYRLAQELENPLLVGEIEGGIPANFHMNNSPAELAQRDDVNRPAVVLSTSGTKLVQKARNSAAVYVACLRNHKAVASYIAGRHSKIAVIGAGSKGEFREEDQLCCAWIAGQLVQAGYTPQDTKTADLIARWEGASLSEILISNSVAYLRRSGQLQDLDFILTKINDLNSVYSLLGNEIVGVGTPVQSTVLRQWTSPVGELPLSS